MHYREVSSRDFGRRGVAISFRCEGCEESSDLCVEEHKGSIYLFWRDEMRCEIPPRQPTSKDNWGRPLTAQERERLGPTLTKVVEDNFSAVVATRDGSVFAFNTATLVGDWLLIRGDTTPAVTWMPITAWDGKGASGWKDDVRSKSAKTLERGASIRLADIVWVADSPEGS
jgi:hypothetical protein